MTQSGTNGKRCHGLAADAADAGALPELARSLLSTLAPQLYDQLRPSAHGSAGRAKRAYSSPASAQLTVHVAINADVRISAHAVEVLREVLRDAGANSATITSGNRSVEDQARVMYDNLRAFGVEQQRALYGSNGDTVIDVYEAALAAGKSEPTVQREMAEQIRALGATRISRHLSSRFDTFDVAWSSIAHGPAFVAALERARQSGKIDSYLIEGSSRAYHIEIRRA